MEDKELKLEILKKIRRGDFQPLTRWHFLMVDWLRWSAFILSIVLGALVLAAAISSLVKNDWQLYREIMDLKMGDIFSGVPLFWLVGLLIFAWLAKKQIYLTRSGYRLGVWKVLGLSLSASLFLGATIFFFGGGDWLENSSARHVPYYSNLNSTNANFWLRPERGVMVGEIVVVADSDNLIIRDPRGLQWLVVGDNIEWIGGQIPKIGSLVRIVGTALIPAGDTIDEQNKMFEARQIQLIRP
ncbi:MAG: hypothetical protein WCW56_00640 [Candidatus Paceibacterota bacterium]|jgi:hypothetical protein